MDQDKPKQPNKLNRRDILAGLVSLPVLGVIGYGLYRQHTDYQKRNSNLLKNVKAVIPKGIPPLVEGQTIRLGIVGCGSRGAYLMKALGFVHPDRMDAYIKNAESSSYWKDYLEQFRQQERLNVKITAVCDIFDKNANRGMAIGANEHQNGTAGKMETAPARFRTYKELAASDQVDAIIIATPDHLHVPIALEAARHGKHVYCEKPLSWTVEETFEIRKVVKETGIVFQLGHQGRQTESYQVARSLINQDVAGKISLIEVCTNRNDPNGAWVYDIDPEANEKTIDWEQFIGPAPWHDFSAERFFAGAVGGITAQALAAIYLPTNTMP